MSLPSRYVFELFKPHDPLSFPSETPIGYHYADRPTKSVQRVREVVFQNFGIGMSPVHIYLPLLSVFLQVTTAYQAMMIKPQWLLS